MTGIYRYQWINNVSCQTHTPLFSRTEMSSQLHQSCHNSLSLSLGRITAWAKSFQNCTWGNQLFGGIVSKRQVSRKHTRSKLNRGTNKVETPDQASLGTNYFIKVRLCLKYREIWLSLKIWRRNPGSLCQWQFSTDITSLSAMVPSQKQNYANSEETFLDQGWLTLFYSKKKYSSWWWSRRTDNSCTGARLGVSKNIL